MKITSKQEAYSEAKKRDQQLLDSLVSVIEANIKTGYVPGFTIIFFPNAINGWAGASYNKRKAVLTLAQELYRDKGWVLKFQSDQREGDWFTLS